jgi:uncharacterized Tic20 family protein
MNDLYDLLFLFHDCFSILEISEQKYRLSAEPVAVYDENGIPMFESDKDARTWGMISHLSGALVVFGIPFLHILGPLAVWLLKRKEYPFVDNQGKEALNFQISMALYGLVGWLMTLILIGWLILGLLIILNLIFIGMATINVNRGKAYHYPFNLRLIK